MKDTSQANERITDDLDRRKADWWRMQFESIIGTAQGVSPMAVYDFDDVRAL